MSLLVQVCKRCLRCVARRRVEWLHAVGAKPVERGKRAAFCSGQKPRQRNGFSRRNGKRSSNRWRRIPIQRRRIFELGWLYDERHPTRRGDLSLPAVFEIKPQTPTMRTSSNNAFTAANSNWPRMCCRCRAHPPRSSNWKDFRAKPAIAGRSRQMARVLRSQLAAAKPIRHQHRFTEHHSQP